MLIQTSGCTSWHSCRLCGEPCDAVPCADEEPCPDCGGPLSVSWEDGNPVTYCPEHG